jgi:hypothetical protein
LASHIEAGTGTGLSRYVSTFFCGSDRSHIDRFTVVLTLAIVLAFPVTRIVRIRHARSTQVAYCCEIPIRDATI